MQAAPTPLDRCQELFALLMLSQRGALNPRPFVQGKYKEPVLKTPTLAPIEWKPPYHGLDMKLARSICLISVIVSLPHPPERALGTGSYEHASLRGSLTVDSRMRLSFSCP